jgi:hypothetical protein
MEDDTKKTRSQKNFSNLKDQLKQDNYPADLPTPAAKLRFPIIPNEIEFLDILSNGQTVRTYKQEIAGMRWRALNEKLCEDGLNPGKYAYGMKFTNMNYIYRGFIKAVGKKIEGDTKGNKEILGLQSALIDLKKDLKNTTGKDVDYLLTITERMHAAEIRIYEKDIDKKDKTINKLETEIDRLESELDKAEITCTQLQQTNSQTTLLDKILTILPGSNPGGLSDSQGIPPEIISIIKKVDYTKLFPEMMNEFVTHLTNIISQLPQKGR